jgi:hypothetical protein
VASYFKIINRALIISAVFIFFQTAAFAFSLTLEWDPNSDDDLAGYIVYYGTASRQYNHDVDIGNHTSCTISGLSKGVRYFFAVTAYDDEGNESIFSSEACYPDCSNSALASDEGGGGGSGCFISAVEHNSALWFLIAGIFILIAGYAYFGLRRKLKKLGGWEAMRHFLLIAHSKRLGGSNAGKL